MSNENSDELSTCIEIECNTFLKVNESDQITKDVNIISRKSTTTEIMQQASNDKQIADIEMQTDKTIESPSGTTSRIQFPVAITIISLLQIFLYMYDSLYREQEYFSQPASIFMFTTRDKRQAWRFITYMLVHQDKLHLSSNIFFQLLGGVPLEISHGWWSVSIIYLAGVLGGSLGVEALSNCKALVGASAGVYSILGASFSSLLLHWKETPDRRIRVFILLVYVLSDILNILCISHIVNNSELKSSICTFVSELTNSRITHFSGFIFGTLTAIIILKNINPRSWERKLQLMSLIILVFVTLLAICLIILFPEFNIKNWITSIDCDEYDVQQT